MSVLEGQTSQQAREEVSLGFNFFYQSIFINRMYFPPRVPALGLQKVLARLLNWLRLLANSSNHQFRLGEASQSSDLRFFRIAHLDDVLGVHQGDMLNILSDRMFRNDSFCSNLFSGSSPWRGKTVDWIDPFHIQQWNQKRSDCRLRGFPNICKYFVNIIDKNLQNQYLYINIASTVLSDKNSCDVNRSVQ